AVGQRTAGRNSARHMVDAPIEVGHRAPVENRFAQIAPLAFEKRDDVLDRALDGSSGDCLAGLRVATKQSLSGRLIASFGKLHANDAALAPNNAAAPDGGLEQRIAPIAGTLFTHEVNIRWRPALPTRLLLPVEIGFHGDPQSFWDRA